MLALRCSINRTDQYLNCDKKINLFSDQKHHYMKLHNTHTFKCSKFTKGINEIYFPLHSEYLMSSLR